MLSKLCAVEAAVRQIVKQRARLFIFAVWAAAAALALAQDPQITLAPPLVPFNPVELPNGKVTRFSFPSAWETPFAENQNVPIHILVPESAKPLPVVVILHYWGAPDLKAENDLAQKLADVGIASVIMELPFHLSRAPKGSGSGELAIQPDPEKLKAMMIQAVWDVRRTIDWIETRQEFDKTKIGLSGTSLGAIVGSMAFAVEPRIDAYCSLLGGADLADTIWSSSRLATEREKLRRNHWTRDKLVDALKEIEPTEYIRSDESRPAYLIAARYDTVVPARSYDALRLALPHMKTMWLETGHYGGFVVQSGVFRSVAKFFSQSLNGEVFTPPSRLYAPTFRIGAPVNLEDGFQVGIGLDIWKFDDEGRGFATVFITPKGPQAFIGMKIGSGLAAGVTVLPRRTTLGILWSFVL